jgi:hypothetical protein
LSIVVSLIERKVQERAAKFNEQTAVAAVEKDRQTGIASDNADKRTADDKPCQVAMERRVLPFLAEVKAQFGEQSPRSRRRSNSTTTVSVSVSVKVRGGA